MGFVGAAAVLCFLISTFALPNVNRDIYNYIVSGRVAAVRTYGGVSLYPWPKGTALTDALTATGCAAPAPFDLTHPQGEAVALAPNGRAYVTMSEGAQAPIVLVGTPPR